MILDKNTVLEITVLTYTPCDLTEISKSAHKKTIRTSNLSILLELRNFRIEREST